MKAVILAAGKGTRMGDLTTEMPKPMLHVQGVPILEHILTGLISAGIREFFIVIGFRGEVISDYFSDGQKWHVRISYGHQAVQDGTGKAPEVAKDFVGGDDFILTYGDILVPAPTYQDMLRRYRSGSFSGLVTCTGSEDVTKGGISFFDKNFCLEKLVEKPSATQLEVLRQEGRLRPGDTAWYNAGIYIFKPLLFDFTAKLEKSPRGEYELTDAISAMVATGHRLAGLEIQGRWVDVRDPQVLAALERGEPFAAPRQVMDAPSLMPGRTVGDTPATLTGTVAIPGSLWKKSLDWIDGHPRATLVLATLVLLGPFLAKPFNMDDPLFVWTARQIHSHPFNPYGFDVNWYGTSQPMWSVTENPPLACYYLALSAGILGWSEVGLHFAFLVPAISVVLGTFRLARHFCKRPFLAGLATLLTPVFLVSSTTVMCDVLMLAFWVWAAVFWLEGIERDSFGRLLTSGVLIALAALTKYYGACLVPLLAVHGWTAGRKPGRWFAALVIPVLALAAYQWATYSLYHQGLFSQAAGYAVKMNQAGGRAPVAAGLISLSFTGGSLAVVLFLSPWLWWRRDLLMLAGGAVALACVLLLLGSALRNYYWLRGTLLLSTEGQMIFWTIGAVLVIALAVGDVARHRDPNAWLLTLWIFGTFVFTAFVNWTINGRSILPMAPAVGILVARRWGGAENRSALRRRFRLVPWLASAAFAFWIAQSDFLLASAVRQSAERTWQHFASEGRKVWFQGHWGFQYYMSELGGIPVDTKQPGIRDGDLLVVPLDNTNIRPPEWDYQEIEFAGPKFLTTMNINIGAGFYTAKAGPLPFAFGKVPTEAVDVFHWKTTAGK